ncbi:MAG: cysteine hydrolase family protein [Nitrososphaeraceae archaeon]
MKFTIIVIFIAVAFLLTQINIQQGYSQEDNNVSTTENNLTEINSIDKNKTALVIVDPQNDFLSEGGAVWDLVGEEVVQNNVVENLVKLRNAATEAGIPIFYSPHYYTEYEYKNWKHPNHIDEIMFERKMFLKGTWGAEFHPDLQPNENTFVLSPHKGLSNFWAGDINIQLRQQDIQNIILAGMSSNLCVESHLRDAIENSYDVIAIKDATAGAGPDSTPAALHNFGFIATEVTTTDDIIERLTK